MTTNGGSIVTQYGEHGRFMRRETSFSDQSQNRGSTMILKIFDRTHTTRPNVVEKHHHKMVAIDGSFILRKAKSSKSYNLSTTAYCMHTAYPRRKKLARKSFSSHSYLSHHCKINASSDVIVDIMRRVCFVVAPDPRPPINTCSDKIGNPWQPRVISPSNIAGWVVCRFWDGG